MIVRGLATALGMSAAAIIGTSHTSAWADAEPVTIAAFLESNGALDAPSLGGVHTGVAPAPGLANEDDVRRKRPNSTETDPLRANRSADPRPAQSDLVGLTRRPINDGPPLNQQPAQNPPAATNAPPATNNPPVASNPPATTTTPSLSSSITSSVLSATSPIRGEILRTFQ